jgi:hypothetical protein
MNGKVDIEAQDTDGDGKPDSYKISISVGRAVLVAVVAAVGSALGYQVL